MTVEFPHDLMGWVTFVGFLSMAGSVLYFNWKNQNIKLLREQVNDMSERIDFLSKEVEDLRQQNGNLKDENATLKFKKNYLKQIVIEALSRKKEVSESLLEEITNGIKLTAKDKRV